MLECCRGLPGYHSRFQQCVLGWDRACCCLFRGLGCQLHQLLLLLLVWGLCSQGQLLRLLLFLGFCWQ